MQATLEIVDVKSNLCVETAETTLPLILLHDGGGTIFQYFFLGPLNRETYAIASPYFESENRPNRGISQLAAEYIQAIRRETQHKSFIIGGLFRPLTPFIFAVLTGFKGWSFGGALSIEIASQLHLDKELTVAGILMLDTACPWYKEQEGIPQVIPQFLATTSKATRRKVERSFENCEHLMNCWTQPSGFESPPVVLIRAIDSVPRPGTITDSRAPATLGWSCFRPINLASIVDVPGDHFGMFSDENVRGRSSGIAWMADLTYRS
jgi:hypothetical protein